MGLQYTFNTVKNIKEGHKGFIIKQKY